MAAVLLDLDGVLHEGERAVFGIVDAVRWLREHGVPHLFLTHTRSRPRAARVQKLAATCGISRNPDAINDVPDWRGRHHEPGAPG